MPLLRSLSSLRSQQRNAVDHVPVLSELHSVVPKHDSALGDLHESEHDCDLLVGQKMFFSSDNCKGVTTGGRNYDADRAGFIHPDSSDVAALKAGGYVIAGGMPKLSRYWVCECGWEAAINSCPKCQRAVRLVT